MVYKSYTKPGKQRNKFYQVIARAFTTFKFHPNPNQDRFPGGTGLHLSQPLSPKLHCSA